MACHAAKAPIEHCISIFATQIAQMFQQCKHVQLGLVSGVAQASVNAPTLESLGSELLASRWVNVSAMEEGRKLQLALSADIPGQVFVAASLLGTALKCFEGQGATPCQYFSATFAV